VLLRWTGTTFIQIRKRINLEIIDNSSFLAHAGQASPLFTGSCPLIMSEK
jgi:hypothetical protein